MYCVDYVVCLPFFFNDPATTEIYTYGHTLSLHDALPILHGWLGKAARQSHTEAKYRHGGMLSEKATTPAQIEEATSWLESAAAQGNDNASLLLAKWLRAAGPQQYLVRGAKWLRYRVEHGDADRQSTRLNSGHQCAPR